MYNNSLSICRKSSCVFRKILHIYYIGHIQRCCICFGSKKISEAIGARIIDNPLYLKIGFYRGLQPLASSFQYGKHTTGQV